VEFFENRCDVVVFWGFSTWSLQINTGLTENTKKRNSDCALLGIKG